MLVGRGWKRSCLGAGDTRLGENRFRGPGGHATVQLASKRPRRRAALVHRR